VEDDTRDALEPFLAHPRVRFFDFPKGELHGELLRHAALQDARGEIVCYLSDDELLLADHVAEMARLLVDADFAHSAPFQVMTDGSMRLLPVDLSRPEFQALIAGSWNAIVLTGSAHTLEAYRRLPHGWRPAPHGIYTDHYMWRQFVALPSFRGRRVNGCSGCRCCKRFVPGAAQLAERAERAVALRDEWGLRRPRDTERRIVPAATELVAGVPLVRHAIDVDRGLVEEEVGVPPVRVDAAEHVLRRGHHVPLNRCHAEFP
jgi:hypothetical protein